MIVQLFIFSLLFVGFGVYSMIRKKYLIGGAFVLLGFMLSGIGAIVVYLYPHTWPF